MNQKEYRRMVIEGVLQPLLVNMVAMGTIDEFEMEEDEDDQVTVIKLKTNRPDDLEDVTMEDVEVARAEEDQLKD